MRNTRRKEEREGYGGGDPSRESARRRTGHVPISNETEVKKGTLETAQKKGLARKKGEIRGLKQCREACEKRGSR